MFEKILKDYTKEFKKGFALYTNANIKSSIMWGYLFFLIVVINTINITITVDYWLLTEIFSVTYGILHVYHYAEKYKINKRSYFSSLIVSRTLSYYFLYNSGWELYPFYPIILAAYVFEPVFLINISVRKSFSERLDYYISRFPFFYGFMLIPSLMYIIAINNYFTYPEDPFINTPLFVTLLITFSFENNEKAPKYARYLPYTEITYDTDPAAIIENIVREKVEKSD